MLCPCRRPPASSASSGCATWTSALERFAPAPDLAALVERHWLVTWALPEGREASVTLLPHPCVNLVLDGGRLAVAGVGRERFTYVYRGAGRVFGVKFRPGAFRPFLGAPVSTITDVTMPAERAVGPARGRARARDGRAAARRAADRGGRGVPAGAVAAGGPAGRARRADRRGAAARPGDRPRRGRRRPVRPAAPHAAAAVRRYVGVSPKWVLRRYRLHEAAAALAASRTGRGRRWRPSWATSTSRTSSATSPPRSASPPSRTHRPACGSRSRSARSGQAHAGVWRLRSSRGRAAHQRRV